MYPGLLLSSLTKRTRISSTMAADLAFMTMTRSLGVPREAKVTLEPRCQLHPPVLFLWTMRPMIYGTDGTRRISLQLMKLNSSMMLSVSWMRSKRRRYTRRGPRGTDVGLYDCSARSGIIRLSCLLIFVINCINIILIAHAYNKLGAMTGKETRQC